MNKKAKTSILKAKWVVRLPEDTKILVSSGKKIEKGELLAVLEKGVIESFECGVVLSKLPKEKVKEIEESWKNKEVKKGELLFSTGGMFAKQVLSPFDGVFVGIDEFFNIKFETNKGEKKEYRSPVEAKVGKIEKEKIVLEFRGRQVKGTGVNASKVWGKIHSEVIEKINDLSSDLEGMIILAKNITKAFLTKADVVGVKGLVTAEKVEAFDDNDIDLPILIIPEDRWKDILRQKDEDKEVLLNSKSGRLLVVIE